MAGDDFNPYEPPQTVSVVPPQDAGFGWTALPAFAMGLAGAIHVTFAVVAAFGLLLAGSVVAGALGAVCGLWGVVLAVRAGRAWLRRDWRSARLLSIIVILSHVVEFILVA